MNFIETNQPNIYQLVENDRLLSFHEVIQGWSSDPLFALRYSDKLLSLTKQDFFWEHPYNMASPESFINVLDFFFSYIGKAYSSGILGQLC